MKWRGVYLFENQLVMLSLVGVIDYQRYAKVLNSNDLCATRCSRLFTFECYDILHVVSVWEHVNWAYCSDHIVLAEDLEVTSL